jgi:hypothetical protein
MMIKEWRAFKGEPLKSLRAFSNRRNSALALDETKQRLFFFHLVRVLNLKPNRKPTTDFMPQSRLCTNA